MIIERKKSSIYTNILIGIALLALISIAIFEPNGGFKFYYLIFVFIAIYDFIVAIYNWKTPLVKLSDNTITFYVFPNKKFTYNIENITADYKAGDYIFITDKANKYKITKSDIPQKQISTFEDYIIRLQKF